MTAARITRSLHRLRVELRILRDTAAEEAVAGLDHALQQGMGIDVRPRPLCLTASAGP